MVARVAVVTGASSGIGAATASRLHADGFHVVLGARRVDALKRLGSRLGDRFSWRQLDVSVLKSVEEFCESVPSCAVLVNNAGFALGDEPIASTDDASWRQCFETNALGVVRMTRALLPKLIDSGDGLVVTIGSVAGFDAYPNSGAYVASKHAVRGIMDTLRLELLGLPVRISEVDPGMVETEFSAVRFGGDQKRARSMYARMTPLQPSDIAECVAFIASLPSHVDVDRLVVRPRDQARPLLVHRSAEVDEPPRL